MNENIADIDRGITKAEKGTSNREKGIKNKIDNSSHNQKKLQCSQLCPENIPTIVNQLNKHVIEDSYFQYLIKDQTYLNEIGQLNKLTDNYIHNNQGKSIHLISIYFEQNISELDLEAKGIIRTIANILPSNMFFEIRGFSSKEGSKNYNYALSKKRAENVMNCLRCYAEIALRETNKIFTIATTPFGEYGNDDEYEYFKYRKSEIHLIVSLNDHFSIKKCNKKNELQKLEKKIRENSTDVEYLSLYKNAAKERKESFIKKFKDDASRVFDILCGNKIFNSFIKNLAYEQQITFKFQREILIRQINREGLCDVYIFFRKIVSEIASEKIESSSSRIMYENVPKSLKVLWSDLSTFLSMNAKF